MRINPTLTAIATLFGLAAFTGQAWAESPAEFYKGKTVTLLVGGAPGGGYATYAGLLARHMARHIPGTPNLVAKSMPGAGSIKALTVLYNRSERDGTVFAAVYKGALIEPLVGSRPVEYDTMKLISVGSMNSEPKVCFTWHKTGITSFEDLQTKEMVTGGSGATSAIFQYPTVIKNLLGAKFKVIGGYKGSADALLAFERGEVTGMCGLGWSSLQTQRAHWLAENKIKILAQIGNKPEKRLVGMNVPEIWQFVRDEDKKKAMRLIFLAPDRPFVLPPGVPADRVKAMQDAFMATMNDPQFLADAAKSKLSILPSSGAEMDALLADLFSSSPKVVDIAKAALSRKGTVKCTAISDPKYCRPERKKK